MAFYLRKAKKIGPLRLNLSKSGIGVSGGVTGARLGLNSGGRTYVHMGRHGLYYRKNLSKTDSNQKVSNEPSGSDIAVDAEVETFHSAALENLTDADSKEFVEELQKKANKIEFWKWLGVYPSIILTITLLVLLVRSKTEDDVFGWQEYTLLGVSVILMSVWSYFLFKFDLRRKTLELYYAFDDELAALFENFSKSFKSFYKTKKIWEILTSQKSNDKKYSGGAASSVGRADIPKILINKSPSPYLDTNVDIPYLKMNKIELFFLPERLLVRRGKKYAAASYRNLTIEVSTSKFIEDGALPKDAVIIDHTWKYVNKNGSPDKRFKDNPKLPICNYSTYHFKSGQGLNERIMTSKLSAMDEFVNSIEKMANSSS